MEVDLQIVKADARHPLAWYRPIARLHQTQIEQGFLASFPESFLTRLYRGIAETPSAFVLAARHGEEVIGFIAGAESTGKVYRRYLLRRGWIDGWVLLPKLCTATNVRRAWETLRYPARTTAAALPEAEILNFCVRQDWQGAGVGRRLFAALCDEFRQRGVQAIRIVTGVDQQRARRFYEQMGARQATTAAIHEGSVSLVFTYSLATTSSGVPARSRAA